MGRELFAGIAFGPEQVFILPIVTPVTAPPVDVRGRFFRVNAGTELYRTTSNFALLISNSETIITFFSKSHLQNNKKYYYLMFVIYTK